MIAATRRTNRPRIVSLINFTGITVFSAASGEVSLQNAMLSEPMPPDAAPDDGVRGALRAMAARYASTGRHGPVTAKSFRDLTERLKRRPGTLPLAAESGEIPLPAETASPPSDDVAPPDMALPRLDRLAPATPPPELESFEPPPQSYTDQPPPYIPSFGLPAFEPLQPQEDSDAAPIAEVERQAVAAEALAGMPGPADQPVLEALPESLEEPQPEIEAAAAPEWPAALDQPAPELHDEAPAESQLQSEPEPEPQPDPELVAEPPFAPVGEVLDAAEKVSPPAAEAAVPDEHFAEPVDPSASAIETEPPPTIESDIEAVEEAASVIPPEPLAAEAQSEEVAPPVLEGQTEVVAEAVEAEAAELSAVAPDLPDDSAELSEIAEPQPLVADTEPAAEAEAAIAQAVLPEAVEAKPPSATAGRVVDALLRTISDAVYAKPSAAERAAFLRDIAELVEQDALQEPAEAVPAVAAPAAMEAPPAASGKPENEPLGHAIAARIRGGSALLRKPGEEPDLFAKAAASLARAPKPEETAGADEETGDLALRLLDMMSGTAGNALPQERALAADTLLRILPRIPVKQLLTVVERVAIMHAPPPLLVAKLIRDPRPEVVAPLLERCMHITDQDLMAAASEGDIAKQRMIARRRVLSPMLADHLIGLGDPSVVLTMIRNPGASFSHDAFYDLAGMASKHHALLAPLTTRADLPPPVAFELFWYVPQELRRFILSRFLTDSENLNKILRITLSTHQGPEGETPASDEKFPDREQVDAAVAHAAGYRLEEAAQALSDIGGISIDTAMRILADREGEPLTVLLKALGYARGKFAGTMDSLRKSESGILRSDRVVDDLQSLFDSLSFNKARILLTYWDWFVRQAGPYAPRN